MATYEIPLRPGPQILSVQLGAENYILRLLFAAAVDGGWMMDILDASGTALIAGLPMVTGADLLAQHKHLGVPGALYVATDGDPDAPLTFDTLGTTGRLYFVT